MSVNVLTSALTLLYLLYLVTQGVTAAPRPSFQNQIPISSVGIFTDFAVFHLGPFVNHKDAIREKKKYLRVKQTPIFSGNSKSATFGKIRLFFF